MVHVMSNISAFYRTKNGSKWTNSHTGYIKNMVSGNLTKLNIKKVNYKLKHWESLW